MITEIGAVKVRGGEVLGEFQTLVNPHQAIPPFIAVLTGITDSMVAAAPPIEQVLPAVPRVRRRAACWSPTTRRSTSGSSSTSPEQQGRPWPRFEVLDTAKLARRVVTRDDAPNCKLSSLAVVFGSTTTPNHRALSDARATVDVLHGLMERLGNLGVHTLEELQTFSSRVTLGPAAQAAPRRAAAARPRRLPLPRRRAAGCSTSARPRTCAPGSAPTSPPPRPAPGWARWSASPPTVAGHRVRHPARGRGPRAAADRRAQAALQPALPVPRAGALDQADPRAVAAAVPGAAGRSTTTPTTSAPTPPRRPPSGAVAALHEAFPIRQCSGRMPKVPRAERRACSPRWAGASPRATAASRADDYAAVVRPAARHRCWPAPTRWSASVVATDDGARRRRAGSRTPGPGATGSASFLRGAARTQRLRALTRCPELVAARREDDRLGGARRPARPAGRRRRDPARRARRRVGRASCGRRPTPWSPARARPRRPPPRSPRRSCAGWSPTASGWCTSRASGPARSAARPSTCAVHDAVEQSRGLAGARSTTAARSAPVAPDRSASVDRMITAIVFVKADVARIPEVAEEIAALDGVSEVYSVTGQIDLIALVRVRNHDDVADGGGRPAQQGARRDGDRDAHRVPGLLPARPGVGVLARPRLSRVSDAAVPGFHATTRDGQGRRARPEHARRAAHPGRPRRRSVARRPELSGRARRRPRCESPDGSPQDGLVARSRLSSLDRRRQRVVPRVRIEHLRGVPSAQSDKYSRFEESAA